jgi:hypothetical protein
MKPNDPNPALVAYKIERTNSSGHPRIVPAPAARHWMDVTTSGWANRCLPLRIANQAGWFILNEQEFEAEWDGRPQLEAVKLTAPDGAPVRGVASMFGYGIITWTIPYLFRTSAGYNLSARGPANIFKDGIAPLDGLVETDWLPYPFTMNWKITRPHRKIRFERDEPFCMLVPMRRGEVESFVPEVRDLAGEPQLEASYRAWHERRKANAGAAKDAPPGEAGKFMQGNYIRGHTELGERATEHQNQLHLRPFPGIAPSAIVEPREELSKPPAGFVSRLLGR